MGLMTPLSHLDVRSMSPEEAKTEWRSAVRKNRLARSERRLAEHAETGANLIADVHPRRSDVGHDHAQRGVGRDGDVDQWLPVTGGREDGGHAGVGDQSGQDGMQTHRRPLLSGAGQRKRPGSRNSPGFVPV